MAVRDQHRVRAGEIGGGRHAKQVRDAATEHRIGKQADAVELHERRRVTQVRDPAVCHAFRMPEPVPYGERVVWEPARPRFHPLRLLVSWLVSAAALLVAAWIVPGVSVNGFGGAVVAALLIAILNALIPPLIAALRIPFMALLGFVIVLLVDAALLELASEIRPEAISVDSFG